MAKTAKVAKRKRWEYEIISVDPGTDIAHDDETLNRKGRDGWEVVAALKIEDGTNFLVLKRPL